MANAPRRSSLRTRAVLIGGITLCIFVGVALLGWFAGWQTIDQYSTALYIAGAGVGLVGAASLVGNQTHGAGGQFGAASLEIAHHQTRGQPDYYQDLKRNFAFLLMTSVVGLLVASGGFAFCSLANGRGTIQTALAAVDADAVVICTPTLTHASFVRLAFAQGKHVLVEKGMTMDWEEAKPLVREAEQAGVRFCVAQNYRYFANMATIKQLLDAPEHPHHPGTVEIVDFMHHRYRPEPRTLNYPYAMVWDMSCHHVDLLAYWLGEARRVTALSYNTSWSQYAHDANIAAIVEYAGGARCHYLLTHSATISDWRIILQGERGRCVLPMCRASSSIPDRPGSSA